MKRLARGVLPKVLAVFALVAGAAIPAARAQDTLRAAAVVNDQVISVLDLVMRTRLAILASGLKDSPEVRSRFQEQVLRTLIDERLQLQEAERLDISVNDGQLETAIEGLARQNKMDRDQFQSFLIRNNILPDTLRDQVRGELTWQTVVQRRLRPSVEVSEEDIDEFIGRFESRSGSMQLRVSEIFLSVDSIQDDQRVKLSADRLAGQLRANADFSALARQFSQSATAPVGGDLGWIAEGQLPDELTQALSRMRPGDMYGPIRTFDGYYILWLRDQRQVTLGDATVDLKRLLFALPADATEQQRQQARAQAAALQPRVTGCDQVEPLAAEFGLRGSGDLGTLKLSELPPGLRRTVATLPLGQASDPILVAAGVTLILVCNRQNGGVDRERIRSSLVSQRLDMLSRRYLRDLRKAANVDIRL